MPVIKHKKTLDDLLLLGDLRLYEVCGPVMRSESGMVKIWVDDLANVMNEVRSKYNFGRAVAAPQLGIMKRLIYMDTGQPVVIINPEITFLSEEKFELWDDCMCFPNLLVRVERHRSVGVRFFNEGWEMQEKVFEDDLSELFQHEYDHLNGVLCTMRAIDGRSFRWRK